MVPSGNKDYIIIIIILWGIKDLSQRVSVALKNASKSQHSVTESIVQILKLWEKKQQKNPLTLNPEKERFTSSEQGQYAVLAVTWLRFEMVFGDRVQLQYQWQFAGEDIEITKLCLSSGFVSHVS